MKRVLYILSVLLTYSCYAQNDPTLNCEFFKYIFNSDDVMYRLLKPCDTTLLFIKNRDSAREFYNCDFIETKLTKVIFVYYDSNYVFEDSTYKYFNCQKLCASIFTTRDSLIHMHISDDERGVYEHLWLSDDSNKIRITKKAFEHFQY